MTTTKTAQSPEIVNREELHFRKIEMRGWRRSDGLFEVEGQVTDRKPHVFKSVNGDKVVPAGAPIHDMGVKLVFDIDMEVLEVSTFTASAPYDDCTAGGEALQSLKGVRIAKGWSSEVRRLLGGARSCTHLMELLIPMGTVAFQSLTMVRQAQPDRLGTDGKPTKIDSCYSYAAERGVVMKKWPNFYTGSKRSKPAG